MDNFLNNEPKILKLIVRVHIYHILIYIQKNKCWFENWIFKNFFMKIYRSQMDYTKVHPIKPMVHYIATANADLFNGTGGRPW